MTTRTSKAAGDSLSLQSFATISDSELVNAILDVYWFSVTLSIEVLGLASADC